MLTFAISYLSFINLLNFSEAFVFHVLDVLRIAAHELDLHSLAPSMDREDLLTRDDRLVIEVLSRCYAGFGAIKSLSSSSV